MKIEIIDFDVKGDERGSLIALDVRNHRVVYKNKEKIF